MKGKKQESDSDLESEEEPAPKKPQGKKTSAKSTPKNSPKVAPVAVKGKQQPKKSLDLNKESEDSEEEAPKAANKRKLSKDSAKGAKGKKAEEEVRGEFEVYVNGLSWSVGEKELDDLFAPYGEIIEVRLLRKEDGKSKGIAFVKFALDSSRQKSLELDQSNQFGRAIGVQESRGKQAFEGAGNKNDARGGAKQGNLPDFNKPIPDNIESTTIFVGNLSYNTTPESLRAFFEEIGTVVDSRIVTEKETGRVLVALFRKEDSVMLSSIASTP